MSWLINRRVTTGFGLAFAILILVSWSAYRSTVELNEAAEWRKHTQEVLIDLRTLGNDLVDMETGARGYALTGQEAFLEPYQRGLASSKTRLQELAQQTSDNPRQQSRIATLEPLIREKTSHLDAQIRIRQTRGLESAADFVGTGIGKHLMDEIRKLINDMVEEEYALLRSRDENVQVSSRNTTILTSLGSLLTLLLIVWAGFVVNRDMNARKRAESLAKRAGEELDRFFTLSVGLHCIAGFDGYFKRLNPAWEATLGFTNEELRAKPFLDFVHPEDRETTTAEAQKLASGVTTVLFENRYLCKDGTFRWLSWNAIPLPDQQLIFASAQDITERKRAEEEKDHLLAILDATSDFIATASPDGQVLYVNRGGRKMVGLSEQDDITQMRIPNFHPKWASEIILEEGLATAVQQRTWARDTALLHRNGKEIPVSQVILAHKSPDERVLYFSTVARDITERKQAEEALLVAKQAAERAKENLQASEENTRLLLESAAEGIYGIDLEGKVTFCNSACLRLLGYSDDHALRGETVHALIHHTRPDGTPYPMEECRIYAAHRLGEGTHADEEVFWRADGTCFPVEYWSYPMHRRGQIVGSVVTFLDITDRKLKEEANLRAKEAAERSNKFKDQFLSTMSHELRTPLNAILGFSELLRDERHGTLNERQQRYLNNVHNGGQHLLRLINDILDLSRIEAGRLDLMVEDVAVQPALEEVVGYLRPLAEKKSQTVSHAGGTGLVVRADPTRLRQVLLNLAGNAIKFTPEGGTVELRVKQEIGEIRVDVQDNGPGIALEDQERVFEAFSRLRDPNRTTEGTGLGLAISKRLVELQGGAIGLESRPGEGSCFFFTLPIGKRVSQEPVTHEQPAAGLTNGRRILVIEDDLEASRLIHAQLASTGYEVVVCNNSERAAEMAADVRPDAITLDLLMSPTSGWDVLFQLRLDPRTREIPVVVVTIVDDSTRGAALAADEYLVKPVEQEKLLAAISRCLSRRGIAVPPPQPILVVEDDQSTREFIVELLTAQGFSVIAAADGAEARDSVAASLPALVVLDLMLPKASGFELLAVWRANPRTADLPVFVLTGKDLTPEEENYLRMHAESLFRKDSPWQEDLVQQLRRVLKPTAEAGP